MLSDNGKFLVYASPFSARNERLKTVGKAVVRIAERLGADVEITQRRDVLSIFVYYKNGGKEKIPVYCDWGKNWNEDDVYHAIKSVVYLFPFFGTPFSLLLKSKEFIGSEGFSPLK